MKKRLLLIACGTFLASAGSAIAAGGDANESMEMHKQMLEDCVAKQSPSTDRHTAMKACMDMLDKHMQDAGKTPEGMSKEAPPAPEMPH